MIRPEHLAYFKDLFEGRAEVSWHAWFKKNNAQLAQDLSRMDYLRLKFYMLDEAEKILREAGIDFTVSPQAKQEKYYSRLSDSVLDERGRPIESIRRSNYNGAYGQYLDGEIAKAKATLIAYMRKIRRRPIEKQIDDINDMCYDGEMNFKYGAHEFGRMILERVAALHIDDDLIDPAIFIARELLQGDKAKANDG